MPNSGDRKTIGGVRKVYVVGAKFTGWRKMPKRGSGRKGPNCNAPNVRCGQHCQKPTWKCNTPVKRKKAPKCNAPNVRCGMHCQKPTWACNGKAKPVQKRKKRTKAQNAPRIRSAASRRWIEKQKAL